MQICTQEDSKLQFPPTYCISYKVQHEESENIRKSKVSVFTSEKLSTLCMYGFSDSMYILIQPYPLNVKWWVFYLEIHNYCH